MSENIEKLMYEISLRVRLFRNSKGVGKHVVVLTPRERLLVEAYRYAKQYEYLGNITTLPDSQQQHDFDNHYQINQYPLVKSTTFIISPEWLTYTFRLCLMMLSARSRYFVETPAICGVRITFSKCHRGLSSGKGSSA